VIWRNDAETDSENSGTLKGFQGWGGAEEVSKWKIL
jgi:hypothetical protein